jgi:hypothetical protein
MNRASQLGVHSPQATDGPLSYFIVLTLGSPRRVTPQPRDKRGRREVELREPKDALDPSLDSVENCKGGVREMCLRPLTEGG